MSCSRRNAAHPVFLRRPTSSYTKCLRSSISSPRLRGEDPGGQRRARVVRVLIAAGCSSSALRFTLCSPATAQSRSFTSRWTTSRDVPGPSDAVWGQYAIHNAAANTRKPTWREMSACTRDSWRVYDGPTVTSPSNPVWRSSPGGEKVALTSGFVSTWRAGRSRPAALVAGSQSLGHAKL